MNLYVAAFSARREQPDGNVAIQTIPGLVVVPSGAEAEQEGMGGAFAVFPEAEGWRDHQVALMEVPNGLDFGKIRLTWRLEQLDQACEGS